MKNKEIKKVPKAFGLNLKRFISGEESFNAIFIAIS